MSLEVHIDWQKVLTQKPYRDIDYVLALDDVARVGALRFRLSAETPFLAAATGKLPPLVRLSALISRWVLVMVRAAVYANCSLMCKPLGRRDELAGLESAWSAFRARLCTI